MKLAFSTIAALLCVSICCAESFSVSYGSKKQSVYYSNAEPNQFETSEDFMHWWVDTTTIFPSGKREMGGILEGTWVELSKRIKKHLSQKYDTALERSLFGERFEVGTPVARMWRTKSGRKPLGDGGLGEDIATVLGGAEHLRDAWNYYKKQDDPFAGIGSVTKEYVEQLETSLEFAKKFRERIGAGSNWQIKKIREQLKYFGDLDLEKPDPAAGRLKRSNPSSMTLESWQRQKIRDMGGFTGAQEIELSDDGTLLIKQVGDSDGALTVQRLASADILRETVEVQPTKSRDLWMVILRTNGRVITKQSQGIGGQAVTDRISRLALFFSTPEAARAAAEAIRKK